MAGRSQQVPPLGVRLTVDVEEHTGARGPRYWARVRWNDPVTGKRASVKRSHPSREAAEQWISHMHQAARTDPGQTLGAHVAHIGDRWVRGIDPTSTFDPYAAGLKRRVLPTLGTWNSCTVARRSRTASQRSSWSSTKQCAMA